MRIVKGWSWIATLEKMAEGLWPWALSLWPWDLGLWPRVFGILVYSLMRARALPRSGSDPKPRVAAPWRLPWEEVELVWQPQRGCV